MKNLLIHHPSADVRAAAVRLLDALTMWERATGRSNLVIIKDASGVQYRSMSGGPIPDHISDEDALSSFSGMAA